MRWTHYIYILFFIFISLSLFIPIYAERAVCFSNGHKIYDKNIIDAYYGLSQYENGLWLIEKKKTIFIYNADCLIFID